MGLRFLAFSLFMIAATSVALADNQTNETNVICVEDVNCDEWSACMNGLQTTTCWDSCDNTRQYIQRCELPVNQTCVSDVNCTEWTDCTGSIKTRVCTDSCDNKMQYVQNCTIEQPAPSQPSRWTVHVSSSSGYIIKSNNSTKNVTNVTQEANQTTITQTLDSNETITNETTATQPNEPSPASGFFTALEPLREAIENFFSSIWNGLRSLLGLQ